MSLSDMHAEKYIEQEAKKRSFIPAPPARPKVEPELEPAVAAEKKPKGKK